MVKVSPTDDGLTWSALENINVPQARVENRAALDEMGGVEGLMKKLKSDPDRGLTLDQVQSSLKRFGDNHFPESQ